MAYSPDVNVLLDGKRHLIVRANAISDGTIGSAIIVDKSAYMGPEGITGIEPTKLVVEEIWYSIQGYEAITLYWDHGASDTVIGSYSGDGYVDYRPYGGLTDDGTTGTGDIIFSYSGGSTDMSGDTFSITLKLRKKQ